jgi:toxin ParE1/3/4
VTEIIWTGPALRDYRNIIERLNDLNPSASHRIEGAVLRRVTQLEAHPKIGRAGRVAGTRELLITRMPYLIIYELQDDDNAALILRVLHGAQRWPPK